MKLTKIDDITVESEGIEDENELAAYVERGKSKYKNHLKKIVCIADGDMVDISYELKSHVPFQRLRRNNGKRAEEHDRVKHDI